MPKAWEKRLHQVAASYARSGKLKKKAGESTKEAKDRFVYSRMRAGGWKPSREK